MVGTGGNWHAIDREWANYWTNGPAQVHSAMTTPARPIYDVRTLADMTTAEIKALEAQYGCEVRPGPPPEAVQP